MPAAVTYSVQKLEKDLDVVLFDRRGHRAKHTAAAGELLNEGHHILRAAGEREAHVKRVATGWEAELRLAYDEGIPVRAVLEITDVFHQQECSTRRRIAAAVFGGSWDALISIRVDLAIGASGDGPVGGYGMRLQGHVEWEFVVALGSPLVRAGTADAQQHLRTSRRRGGRRLAQPAAVRRGLAHW